MKIEAFAIILLGKKLIHISSSEYEEIKLSDKGYKGAVGALKHIEDYGTANGFKVSSVNMTEQGFTIFLVKD